MKITTEPRSDQWNADDFVGSARTFTIAGVRPGSAEQKYDIELAEGEGRVWRPPLTVLRLLVEAWTDDAATWIGRRVTLYRDSSIRFGKDQVGGIRVSHMSNLPDGKPFTTMLTVSRGRREKFTVQPLPDAPAAKDWDAVIATAQGLTEVEQLSDLWRREGVGSAPEQVKAAITARVEEIKAQATDVPEDNFGSDK